MALIVKLAVAVALLSGQGAFLFAATDDTPLRAQLRYWLIGVLFPVVGLYPAARHRFTRAP